MPQELTYLPRVLRRAVVKQRDHLILGNTRSAFKARTMSPKDAVHRCSPAFRRLTERRSF